MEVLGKAALLPGNGRRLCTAIVQTRIPFTNLIVPCRKDRLLWAVVAKKCQEQKKKTKKKKKRSSCYCLASTTRQSRDTTPKTTMGPGRQCNELFPHVGFGFFSRAFLVRDRGAASSPCPPSDVKLSRTWTGRLSTGQCVFPRWFRVTMPSIRLKFGPCAHPVLCVDKNAEGKTATTYFA